VLSPVLSAFWHNEEFGEGEEWQVFLVTEAGSRAGLECQWLVVVFEYQLQMK
jgi:hypothetical protein